MKQKKNYKIAFFMGAFALAMGIFTNAELVKAEGENARNERSYIYFGSYPQSQVTDEGLIADIESAINKKYEESGANALFGEVGIDIEVDGEMYRRIGYSDQRHGKKNTPN